MQVREAAIEDLDVIADFIAAEAREAEGRDLDFGTVRLGIRRGLEDSSIARYWLLTDDDGIAVGCASVVKEWSDWNAGFYWWIQSMFISPDCRGQGQLNTLLGFISEEAHDQGCLELRLYVHKGNTAAVRAYEKVDFRTAPYLVMSKRT